MYVFISPPLPNWGKAKGCWTLNSEGLQRMALVRNVCVSDVSAWVSLERWLSAEETSSMAEQVQQELTEAAFRAGFDELLGVQSVWGCEPGHCLGLLTDSSGIQESGILMQFCLFTRIYKATQFHCFCGFSPRWTSQSAQPLLCSQAHLLWRCLLHQHTFQHLADSCWHLCKQRPDGWRKGSSQPLCLAVECSGWDQAPWNPVRFTWVMWNVNAVLWTPDSQVASNALRSGDHGLASNGH